MEDRVIELLKESEALLTGHFLLSSGKHSNRYIQCAKLTQYPEKAEEVCAIIASKLKGEKIDVVCGPAMGGIVISYELARTLGVRAIFTERKDNIMELRRGFEVRPGERVLIVEDVVTTGKSSKETIEVLKQFDAEIVGIACIVDRTNGADIGYRLFPATKIMIDTYEKDNCPLCKQGLELVKPGSRKQ